MILPKVLSEVTMRFFGWLLIFLSMTLVSCTKSYNCDENQAHNKMLALGKASARLLARGGEGGTQLGHQIGSDSGAVAELIAQKKFNEACAKAAAIEEQWGLDLTEEAKDMITFEQLAKDGGKGSGTCSIADVAVKQMEIHGLLQAEVDAGRLKDDVFREFGDDVKGLGELMLTNPTKGCELLERIRAKHNL